MFDLDRWQEIFATIKQNRLRTVLTGFSVAWGIFILILLLGSGTGLRNGVNEAFSDNAKNSMFFREGQTSMPYKGTKPGREIKFTNEDYKVIKQHVDGIKHISARLNFRSDVNISYKSNHGSFEIRGTHGDHRFYTKLEVEKGRFINPDDIEKSRKIIVIGRPVVEAMFGREDPIGKYLIINRIPFKVVGVFSDDGNAREERRIYIPITTSQKVFAGDQGIDYVVLNVAEPTLEASMKVQEDIVEILSARHNFDPLDERAVYSRAAIESFQRIMGTLNMVNLFVIIIGIMTLTAGIVGVGNIMMIVVKERTKEIGIRKALGATPANIISSIIHESLIITGFFGYLGLVIGVFILEMAGPYLPEDGLFLNPGVDFNTAIGATVLIMISGVLAGLIPAVKAAYINPINALRDE